MSNLGEGIRDNVIADVVMNMYKKEYSLEQIADIVEKSVEEVEVVVKKRKNKVILGDFDGFNKAMTDGRLTEPSDGKVYRLREAIMLSKQLGKLLTEEEMKRFEIR